MLLRKEHARVVPRVGCGKSTTESANAWLLPFHFVYSPTKNNQNSKIDAFSAGISLGKPTQKARTVDDLKRPATLTTAGGGSRVMVEATGIYQRRFEKGLVLVNPTQAALNVTLEKAMDRVRPKGGGAVKTDGTLLGSLSYDHDVTTVVIRPSSAAILLDHAPLPSDDTMGDDAVSAGAHW